MSSGLPFAPRNKGKGGVMMSDPQNRRRRLSGPVRVALAVLVLGLGIYGLQRWQKAQEDEKIDRLAEAFIDSMGTVTYRVTGSGPSADVTIETPSGTEQLTVDPPTSGTIEVPAGTYVWMSVTGGDEVGCELVASDGSVIESQPPGIVAVCSGTAR